MEIENFHIIDIAKEEAFPSSIKESIQNIIKKEGFVTQKVYKREISTGGGNYTGSLFEVDIKGKTLEEAKEINLFVKRSISQTCEDSKTFLSVPGAYAKEQLFYKEITKMFTKLEEEAKVPREARLRTIKGFTVSSLEGIILENLRKQGYRTLNRMETFPIRFAELSIKQLAIFHGLSLVIKHRNPEYFDRKLRTLTMPFTFNETWKAVARNLLNITKANLDEEWQKKVETYFANCPDKYIANYYTKSSTMQCLCHGDYNKNNILVKTVNGDILDVVPIDYQLMYVGNPMNDFFYLIYLGSDREFRDKHLVALKNLYYATLKVYIQYFDMDVEDIYPRKMFECDFKDRREIGLILASVVLPIVFVVEEEVPSFEKHDLTKVNFRVDPRFRKRIVEVLEEYEELGFL